ncbi:peptidoglycan-binding protein [Pelotomaculum propionicicum]|uniref:D-gamma-glutamyl-meso-diaminopimelic acid endopeptidase CwlS n=1 Tax=Pelotomaculum propionicicum TaxID=258475 RepID=A0A4Y7RTG8_9FIRM|nr:peptidoglycan-binding protein [Pelotomaculum propionicicum]NLI14173.1 peptidase [Peptococcaceae bacterium]TEB12019.1 D-gamma-glutamyl-meso-diaminopimelic acid endopeptidase CwlS [Pelotomaculum propionicicum]
MKRNFIIFVLLLTTVVFLSLSLPVYAEGEALKEGMSGDSVLNLQARLCDLGYYRGALDGSFGPGTRSALISFQSDNNLEADGIAGQATLTALDITSAPSGGDQLPLKVGSSGTMVLRLQARLHDLGYYQGALDGSYGSGTSSAVASFQSANQLAADGIAGMDTLRALSLISSEVSRGDTSTRTDTTQNNAQPPYKEGMSGNNVLKLQTRLSELGYYQGPLDGKFGAGTRSAVAIFQADNYLEIDGIAGLATLTALQSAKPRSAIPNRGDVDRKAPALVAFAKQFLGTPYVWAGKSPSGFDCSGFTYYVFNHFGISIPRAADEQYFSGAKVSQPQLGDLVFFSTYEAGPSHVGIYIGDNQFIHSSSGTGDVTITSLSASYYSARYLGACRYLR